MYVTVTVEQAPDHPLILGTILLLLALEEVDASFGERYRDLHLVFPKGGAGRRS